MADHDKFSEHADPFCFRYKKYYEDKYLNKLKKEESPTSILTIDTLSNTTKNILKKIKNICEKKDPEKKTELWYKELL